MSRVAIRRTTYGDYGAHPTTLLRLLGVAKSTPGPWGYGWGYLILCPYSTCCTFKHFCGDFDSDLGQTCLFRRRLDVGVRRPPDVREANDTSAALPSRS